MDFWGMFPQPMCYSAHVQKPPQKRNRTHFREWQLDILEKTFLKTNYISVDQRDQLSRDLNLSDSTIRVWFQNRRTKARREGTMEPATPYRDSVPKEKSSPLTAIRRERKKKTGRVLPPSLALPTPMEDGCMSSSVSTECCCCPYGRYLPSPIQHPYLLPFSRSPWSPAFSPGASSWSPAFSPGASPGFSLMFQFPPLMSPLTSGARLLDGANRTGSYVDFKSLEQR